MQLSHIEGYTSTMKCDIEVLQSPDISSVNVTMPFFMYTQFTETTDLQQVR